MQMRQDKEAAFLRAKVAALVPAVGRTAVG